MQTWNQTGIKLNDSLPRTYFPSFALQAHSPRFNLVDCKLQFHSSALISLDRALKWPLNYLSVKSDLLYQPQAEESRPHGWLMRPAAARHSPGDQTRGPPRKGYSHPLSPAVSPGEWGGLLHIPSFLFGLPA